MRLRSLTLRWRLTLWYAGSLALAFALLGGLVYGLVRYQLVRHHDHALERAADEVQAVLARELDCERLTRTQRDDLDRIGGLVLFHEAANGRVFYRSAAAEDVPIPPALLMSGALDGREGTFELQAGDPPLRIYSRPYRSRAGRRGVIRVAERLGDVASPLRSLLLALLGLSPLAVAGSAAVGYWLARNALAPVDSVSRLARDIEATSLERRLPPSETDDEIGRLVGTFNQMIARLEDSFNGMKRFTADASHELKAPLARLRGVVDVTLAKDRETERYRAVLAAIGEDVDRLRSITEDLLILARADAGHVDLERAAVRLDVVGAEAAESLRTTARECGAHLDVRCHSPVLVVGDERWLRQLATNLLDNAVRFAPLGRGGATSARVTLSVEQVGSEAILSVEDTGPGLPHGEEGRIFERFFRGDAHVEGSEEGVGLGLAIAAWIVRAHHGVISAASRDAGGTRFVVRFPLALLDRAT